ncbi:MAG TPA: PPC domain-containing protein [Planctomycetaceae bacterium]
MKHFAFIATILGSLLFTSLTSAQTNNSYPMLMSVKPGAAQIGQTTECEVNARYILSGADQVIVAGEGVKGEIVPEEKSDKDPKEEPKPGKRRGRGQKNASKIKVRFTVAADAVPGVRDFRIITPHGASTVGQIVVARDPIISEVAGNDTLDKAQAIALPATVCGAIEKAEDLDFFKFKVEAGTGLTFHVRSQRLLNRLHDMQTRVDPMITLKTAAGVTLAASDNYYAGDPLLFHKFEQAGEYVLEVRDVRYQGNGDWTYCLEINNRPFVTQALPLAVKAGTETKLSLVGYNLPADPSLSLTLPAEMPAGLRWVSPPVGGQPANDFALLVTGLPTVLEAPPSAAPVAGTAEATAAAANPATTAQLFTVPAVIAGRIDSSGESDRYAFEVKAGDKLSFEVVARRAQSGLDPFLRILNDKGAGISEADDMTFDRVVSADSFLENWTAPADGKYLVEIRDLHLRGGPQYTYAVQVSKAEPHFLIQIDSDKTLLAPGIASVFYVRALRKNGFAGDIQLAVEGLPAGVTAVAGKILANANDGCVILQAAADAPDGAANIRVLGTATHPVPNGQPLALSAAAHPMQEYYSPGGGRGTYPVEFHTVSVADPMDVRAVKLSLTNVVLKPGASTKIEVEIERAPGFKGNVTLDVLFQHLEQPFGNSLPKGVKIDGAASKTLLTGEETKGFITLKAAADAAPVEKQLIPVMAHISINFVMKHTLCGAPVFVTVEPK